MTPQQAIKLLDDVVKQIALTRDQHISVQQALMVLTPKVEVKEEVKEETQN